MSHTCRHCDGSGVVVTECRSCEGEGVLYDEGELSPREEQRQLEALRKKELELLASWGGTIGDQKRRQAEQVGIA